MLDVIAAGFAYYARFKSGAKRGVEDLLEDFAGMKVDGSVLPLEIIMLLDVFDFE
jgi:hypothetical protein